MAFPLRTLVPGLMLLGLVLAPSSRGYAQINNGNNGIAVRSVGGVSIDPSGVLKNLDPVARKDLAELRAKALGTVPADLQTPTSLRMVSLRQLQETIAEHMQLNKPLPTEVLALAGLQRIRYVFVDPANKDIVIAGPAEGWKVTPEGNLVGVKSLRPVMQLDDLLVALRAIDQARRGGITCSIDPTKEGLQKVAQYVSTLKSITNPQPIAAEQEKLLGMQEISVTGVPGDSHFAQVLVAADYRMKRLGMKLDQSPVKGFVSYLDMVAPKESIYPRWWLSPQYDALGKSEDGLAYELRGVGVKCLSAEDQFAADGQRKVGKAANSSARWAESMTANYEKLAVAEPVFAELQNCMDLAVMAALLQKNAMLDKVDLKLDLLLNAQALPHAKFAVPSQVPSVSSFLKKGTNWIITASGGVEMQPWAVVQKDEASAATSEAKTKSLAARGKTWWWN
jgi:hypothetical protein